MTKLDIINKVIEEMGLQKPKAEEAVELVIDKIKQTLSNGEPVILRRFGSFSVRDKNPRIGRNPKTGEEAEITARRVVRFKSGKHFRDAANK
ncbi:MAG: integration host factor subunit alpha [Nitrospinae bacterium]|nr:integration host factor subunit alpha [Nitrospinota bacterium]